MIQVENANSEHTRFNHMSWGVDADLWLISLDGTRAERIWTSGPRHAALHPHISDDGRLIVFAERRPTERVTRRLFHPWSAFDGQNPGTDGAIGKSGKAESPQIWLLEFDGDKVVPK